MRKKFQVRTPVKAGGTHVIFLIAVTLFCLAGGFQALGQVNFKPLERGDYTEVEEKLIVLRGLEVSADYALRIKSDKNDDLPFQNRGTETFQDLRLRLKTLFHRDVAIHLTLDLGKGDFADSSLRESELDDRGRLINSQSTGVNAREAYLRYKFNPKSNILFGKHEISHAIYFKG